VSQLDRVAAIRRLRLRRDDPQPVDAGSIRNQLGILRVANWGRIDGEPLFAVGPDTGNRKIDVDLVDPDSGVLAGLKRELILVRLASRELAFDRLLRFQLHRFDGLRGRDVTAGLCKQSAGGDNEERKARGQALHWGPQPLSSANGRRDYTLSARAAALQTSLPARLTGARAADCGARANLLPPAFRVTFPQLTTGPCEPPDA
jgi:hypothetical protein